MVPSLLYHLPPLPSEAHLVEEVHHAAKTAAHLDQEEAEIELLALWASLMENGDEAKESRNTLARVEAVAVVNVSVEEEEIDPIEGCDKTALASTQPSPRHT